MLRSKIVSVVNICARHGWPVVIIAAILAVLCGYYSAVNFTIDTNVNKLISRDLDWRKNELALDAAFPYRHEIIVAVVEAPTSELASQATAELIEKLATQTKVFKSVTEPAGGPFFSKNALLFASLDQTTAFTSQFAQSRPLLQVLVQDQNWRGLVQGLSLALAGVQRNMSTCVITRPTPGTPASLRSASPAPALPARKNRACRRHVPSPAANLRPRFPV